MTEFSTSQDGNTPPQSATLSSLTSALTHLTALATKATHALLAPLGTHATGNFEHEGEFLVLLDAEAGEGALHELGVSAHETDEVAWDELSVLNHGLELGDGSSALDIIGRRGPRGSGYNNLH